MNRLFSSALKLNSMGWMALLGAAALSPLAWAAPAAVDIDTPYSLRPGRCIEISFPEPIVAEAEVCKPVAAELLPTISPAQHTDAVWVSTSTMSLSLRENAVERLPYDLVVPEGLRSMGGNAMPGAQEILVEYSDYYLDRGNETYTPGSPIFFSACSEVNDDVIAEAVPKAYYLVRASRNEEEIARMPASIRQATVADALAHWKSYCEMADFDNEEEEHEALSALAPDAPLPHVWLADCCPLNGPSEDAVLMLPGLGDFDKKSRSFEDKFVARCALSSSYSMELESTLLEAMRYRVELKASHPMDCTDAAAAFDATSWYIYEVDGDTFEGDYKQGLLEKKDGAYVPSAALLEIFPQLANFRLTPDLEATAASLQTRARREGEPLSGLPGLVLTAETGPCRVALRCEPGLRSIYGHEPEARWAGVEGKWWEKICTTLSTPRPELSCSVMLSGLREGGKRQVLYRSENVHNIRARVFRADGAGAETARLLREYTRQYRQQRSRVSRDWSEQEQEAAPATRFMKTRNLQLEVAECELPVAEKYGSFDPSSLFPDKPARGTYIIELEGRSLDNDWSSGYVHTQSLVQVTDLGLMWKESAGGLFAYAYHLSDASALEEGTLLVLNAEGETLASLPVSQGIARGELPQGAAFLQLRAGEDAYTSAIAYDIDQLYYNPDWDYYVRKLGINPSCFPKTSVFLFTDRGIYRPGETMHVRGMVRFITGDDISTPAVEELRLLLSVGEYRREYVAPVAADGSFELSIKLEEEGLDGSGSLHANIRFAGDKDGTTADELVLLQHGAKLDDYYATSLLEENREGFYESFLVADYKRNEFEIEAELKLEGEEVKMDATATAFTGVPVSGGKVSWVMQRTDHNVFPEKYPDFCFGDYSDGRYSYRWDSSNGNRSVDTERGELDADGKGSVSFTLDEQRFPARSVVRVTASVTNGTEQTLRCTRRVTVESSAVYAGLRVGSRLTEQGQSIPLDAVLVQSDEESYTGEPIPCQVKVTCRRFRSYRYGAGAMSSVHNVQEDTELFNGELAVGGSPARLEIPTGGPGVYEIELKGRDAQGKPFAAALRHYVWGGSDISPWQYEPGEHLELTPDKESYRVGETARILVQTPVDAELLVTLERGGVRRVLRRTVTVDKPVIEIPLEPGDGPVSYVSAFLVQKEQGRAINGLPLLKFGTTELRVDVPEKRLSVQLQTPDELPLIRKEWTAGGRVTDAAGQPVSGARVAFYAVDEGTLQVLGYKLPDAFRHYYADRPCGVRTFSTNGQLVGDAAAQQDFGNKGEFIGGGSAADDPDAIPVPVVRDNFNPCAFWLGATCTDADGRFSATYAHPDTMTRYRLMAVADAGDRFGSAESSYTVVQPVMLEGAVPATATAGDTVDLPVTISMLPQALPESARGQAEWTISLKGENATPLVPSRSVTLTGREPVTVTFPVRIDKAAPTRLTWSVDSPNPALKGMSDAIALSFEAVPPTPKLRERFLAVLKPGEPSNPSNWVEGDLAGDTKLELVVSSCPLVGATAGFDYLFRYPYGCLEQTSSTLLPWLFHEQFERALALRYPQGASAAARISKATESLLSRRRADGRFGYWDKSGSASEFTSYALLVLGYAQENGSRLRYSRQVVLEDMKTQEEASLIGLLTLARAPEGLKVADFDAVLARHAKRSQAENWLIAAVARLIRHPQANDLLAQAQQPQQEEQEWRVGSVAPPAECARMLELIIREPRADSTAETLRDFISKSVESGCINSTWDAGWLTILIHEYLERQEKDEVHTSFRTTMQLALAHELAATTRKLYVSGLAEGYQLGAQPNAVVDKGFCVERRYEKLMPDGSWQPGNVFCVGDVVRVTLSTHATAGTQSRYFVLEDRVPASFEVVNPNLPSQSLPPGIATQRARAWFRPSWVDHCEYGRDCVSFFATSWYGNSPSLEVSYIVRVVRSGEVCAPAARAELMYRPQVYGLSIPQRFTVQPRP